MKRLVVLLAVSLFLIGFSVAIFAENSTATNVAGTSGENSAISTTGVNNSTISSVPNNNESPEVSVSGVVSNHENEENESPSSLYNASEENEEHPNLINIHEPFCGMSSLGSCQTDSDCIAGGCSGQVCQSKSEESSVTPCIYRPCFASAIYKVNCSCIENECRWSVLTEAQIENITSTGNRIKPTVTTACPDSCTCTGSSVKCTLADGRIMIIFAGNSGNVIIQVKGENMTTNVTLYKADGNLYGLFRNNETREIKMLPDQVKERVREKLDRDFDDENISLDDNGTYQYTADKPAKLFFIFPVKVPVEAHVDSATGNITNIKIGKWWSFLAKDISATPIVGYSCGTVTPGQNNACCQTKGFDIWNSATNECEFATTTTA